MKYRAAPATWNEAKNVCACANGTLPIFRNRDELSEFMALVKLSPYINDLSKKVLKAKFYTPSPKHFEVVAIALVGLVVNLKHKVSQPPQEQVWMERNGEIGPCQDFAPSPTSTSITFP